MGAKEILDSSKKKMDAQIEHLQDELKTIRTGAANSSMLDRIEVEYYGTMTPLKQLAGVSVQEGRTLVIKPYDRSSLKGIEKAVNTSDLGLPAQNDGQVVRITVPQLTGETRKEMTKKVGKIAEDVKIAIRNIRRDANDAAKKDETLSEDNEKDCLDRIQKQTDEYIKKVESIANAKDAEVLKV
jgi:ribosome recycling factor